MSVRMVRQRRISRVSVVLLLFSAGDAEELA